MGVWKSITVLALSIATFSTNVSAQVDCTAKKCRGSQTGTSFEGDESCWDILVYISTDDGAPCHWEGSICVGDPCPVYWEVNIDPATGTGCSGECDMRLRVIVTNCGTEILNASISVGSGYESSGNNYIPCDCNLTINVSAQGTSDCVSSDFEVERIGFCSNCM